MKSRSAELRERHRRVFRWSIGIAILLHVALFALWPAFRVEPLDGSDEDLAEASQAEGRPFYVQVVFGPPEILSSDGEMVREDRQLEAGRVLLLPAECGVLEQVGAGPPHGRVHLRVWKSGRSDVIEVTESTGSRCGDEVMTAMAGALWYHWLPNDRFPAPVEVIQPVTLVTEDE